MGNYFVLDKPLPLDAGQEICPGCHVVADRREDTVGGRAWCGRCGHSLDILPARRRRSPGKPVLILRAAPGKAASVAGEAARRIRRDSPLRTIMLGAITFIGAPVGVVLLIVGLAKLMGP